MFMRKWYIVFRKNGLLHKLVNWLPFGQLEDCRVGLDTTSYILWRLKPSPSKKG